MLLVFESTTVAGRLDQKLVNSQVHGKTTWEKSTVTWINVFAYRPTQAGLVADLLLVPNGSLVRRQRQFSTRLTLLTTSQGSAVPSHCDTGGAQCQSPNHRLEHNIGMAQSAALRGPQIHSGL